MSGISIEIPTIDSGHRWIRVGKGERDHIAYNVGQDDCHTECGLTVEAHRVKEIETPRLPCSICVDVYKESFDSGGDSHAVTD